MLYLDFAASAPIRPSALLALKESSLADFANPSAAHKLGKETLKKVENCRDVFLEKLNAKEIYNFIFTSSATESNNMIIKGLEILPDEKLFLCTGDHPSVVESVKKLRSRGVWVEKIPLKPNSQIDEEKLISLLDLQAKLLVLSEVNNQSGVFNDCKNLAMKIKNTFPNIHIHLDAVQSFGKFSLDLNGGLIDSISISSHKIGGPKGIAGLFLKKNLKINPLIEGGGQEFGLRPSTVAAPLVISFKEAFLESLEGRDEKFSIVRKNYEMLKRELKKRIPKIIFPFGDDFCSGPYILVFAIPKISSDIILRHLETKNIFISSSAACSSKIKGDNPVFRELGLPKELNKNILRISFDERIGEGEIFHFIQTMENVYNDLRHLI